MHKFIDIVFNGEHEPSVGLTFIEAEDEQGRSISIGEWINDGDLKRLRLRASELDDRLVSADVIGRLQEQLADRDNELKRLRAIVEDTSGRSGWFRQIVHERGRQDDKWGEQNHPDGMGEVWKAAADDAREATDRAAANGTVTWRHIILEEVYEMIAESDEDRIIAEGVQIAAVLAQHREAIMRRRENAGQAVIPSGS